MNTKTTWRKKWDVFEIILTSSDFARFSLIISNFLSPGDLTRIYVYSLFFRDLTKNCRQTSLIGFSELISGFWIRIEDLSSLTENSGKICETASWRVFGKTFLTIFFTRRKSRQIFLRFIFMWLWRCDVTRISFSRFHEIFSWLFLTPDDLTRFSDVLNYKFSGTKISAKWSGTKLQLWTYVFEKIGWNPYPVSGIEIRIHFCETFKSMHRKWNG